MYMFISNSFNIQHDGSRRTRDDEITGVTMAAGACRWSDGEAWIAGSRMNNMQWRTRSCATRSRVLQPASPDAVMPHPQAPKRQTIGG